MSESAVIYEPWGNWPADFGDSAVEYGLLQNQCAWLALPQLGWLRLEGKDAASFMQGLLTADIRSLPLGKTREAFALDAQGKILFHVHVHRQAATSFLIQTIAARVDALFQHLDKYLIMEAAVLSKVDGMTCLSLQGKTASIHGAELSAFATVLELDRCGLGGIDLVFPAGELEAMQTRLAQLAPRLGISALEQIRTENFLARFGLDMEEGNNPLLYGKGGDRIAYTKGCFLGQETVARTRDRGHPPKRLVQFQGEGKVPTPGTEVSLEGKPSGAITSALWSPTRQAVVGFALIKYADAVLEVCLTDAAGNTWRIVAISEY